MNKYSIAKSEIMNDRLTASGDTDSNSRAMGLSYRNPLTNSRPKLCNNYVNKDCDFIFTCLTMCVYDLGLNNLYCSLSNNHAPGGGVTPLLLLID